MSTNEKLAVPMTVDSLEVALRLARRELRRVERQAEARRRCLPADGELDDRLAAEASDLSWLIADLEDVS